MSAVREKDAIFRAVRRLFTTFVDAPTSASQGALTPARVIPKCASQGTRMLLGDTSSV